MSNTLLNKSDVMKVIEEMKIEIDAYWTSIDDKHKMRKDIEIKVLDKLLSHVQKMEGVNEWISVNERLPEKDTTILVTGEVSKGILYYTEGVGTPGYCTHWMPYPDLPPHP